MTDPTTPADQDPYSAPLPTPYPAAGQWGPPVPPAVPPPVPPTWRPTAADRLRAAVAGALNLSGLGVGYLLTRRWVAAGVCWVATGILLLVTLPVGPKGVPAGVVAGYLVFLAIVAVHGAVRALRSPMTWPGQTWVAAALALVLLAVPAGGVVLYDHARSNAIQTMLLGRLKQADDLVAIGARDSDGAHQVYGNALAGYRDLLIDHPGSRAGKLVPARLASFYQTVAAPFADGQFCQAIAPLTYLRTVPTTIPAPALGDLATWPDDRLATALLRCGTTAFDAADGSPGASSYLQQLMTTFPRSAQAAQVPATAAATIDTTAAGLTGPDPCGATEKLRKLVTQLSALSSTENNQRAALVKDHDTADRDVESGTFTCGKSQYAKGAFADAEKTMQSFVTGYPKDPDNALAGKFVIAAQIAQQDADAGKQPPTLAVGGSVTIIIANDSPTATHVLYTGSATGTVDLAACTKCKAYPTAQSAKDNACASASIDYPNTTITVPPGTLYIFDTGNSGPLAAKVITLQAGAGDIEGFCTYETSSYNPLSPLVPAPVSG
ncbi:MAG: hypothetical protein ACJ786_16640 [Catenulispora sp.]